MKTITDSLKNFYAKLGGNPSNLPSRSTSADIIDAMSDVYTDKEGTHVEVTTQVTEGTKIATVKTNNEDHDIYAPKELPSVTSSDEGKVLTVDSNGAWGAVTPSGGAGVSIIVCSETMVSDQHRLVLPSGMTVTDLMRRLDSGEFIILMNNNNDVSTITCIYYYPERFDKNVQGEYGYVVFSSPWFQQDTVDVAEGAAGNNYLTLTSKIYQTLE